MNDDYAAMPTNSATCARVPTTSQMGKGYKAHNEQILAEPHVEGATQCPLKRRYRPECWRL
jgi:hypothetical protein